MLKRYKAVITIFLLLGTIKSFSQEITFKEKQRIQKLEQVLDSMESSIKGLTQTVDFNVSETELPVFIRAVGKAKKVNLSVDTKLENITLSHNFSNANVKDILLYLCKEYKLTFDITGNIISLKKYVPQLEKKSLLKEIPITYNLDKDLFFIDLKKDTLSVVFKKITNITGKNLVFSPGLENKKISGYIKEKSFESAMDKLAFSNNLLITKTSDDYYLFESDDNQLTTTSSKQRPSQRPKRYKNKNFFFKVLDMDTQELEVDFENTQISSIIRDIGYDLKINVFTNAPLNNIGTASVKASSISYDDLLTKILEDSPFTYKKKDGVYYFGKEKQASLRSSVVIPLMYRSIEIMNQPIGGRNQRNFNSNNNSGSNYNTSRNNTNQNFNNSNQQNNFSSQQQRLDTRNNQSFGNYSSKSEALVNILPEDVKKDLEIITDIELNSFIVSGEAQKIEKFKKFISKIDKKIPFILIEVMILEISKNATVNAGIDLGLGKEPTKDIGSLFPSANVTLGATTINKIIGGFNGMGPVNAGKVVPNFFAKIQLMETNGDIKIRSTPKLSTLSGHQATLSNGERSYYKIERTDVIGTQNPQTVITNDYVPIDADLSISIRPMVSGSEQITLSINVNQSSFNGKKIDASAPIGMNSREFTSTIRVQDQDVIILGGLEENVKNDSGSGVPLLARIPVIKWLFSKKTRTNSKTKLSVLIKPTIIR
ncbi:general secretion pathway protein GspD [Tenacibaculum sp. AHE15PA]|uniref:type II secretion system protein GspD n=1 Tax=unclassified Tenacibaculum TaxID=2635139 RepID=UPI001C4F68AC|nr:MULTISPECIES: general secretion pathway protein GspD [unclassified Tenacibaculum]QXP72533.1 general secretion pathway protein GspD [Tenacibaculum sp. AHE14PA]QXP76448.1 general secretion pathway protein GspD [Tenacibaculum sp. AHE15PA]